MAFPGQPPDYTEMLGASIVWVLEITYAGRVFRFSEFEGFTVESDDGDITYFGGLEVDLTLPLNLFTNSPDILSMPVSLIFPIDVAELAAAGHDLSTATAELSFVPVDAEGNPRTYEDRFVVLLGNVVEPQYGALGEAVRFSVEQNAYEDTAVFPGLDAIITTDAWPDAEPQVVGRPYPFVFGIPMNGTTAGSPAYLIQLGGGGPSPMLVIAGHEVRAEYVDIYRADQTTPGTGDTSGPYPVEYVTDLYGRRIAVVKNVGFGLSAVGYGQDFYTIWRNTTPAPDEYVGGHWNNKRTAELIGAGDILMYMMLQTSLDVDLGRFAAAAEYLNHFRFSGYIDEQVSPWEWLQDNILPLIPVSIVGGPHGLEPIIWRRETIKEDAVAHIQATPTDETDRRDAYRLGLITYENASDLVNHLTFEFFYRPVSNDAAFTRHVRLSAESGLLEAWTTNDDVDAMSVYAKLSEARYGRRVDTLDSHYVTERATAMAILHWMIRAKGFRHRVVQYAADIRWSFLRIGSIITITDDDVHLSEQPAFIREISWQDGGLVWTLVLVDDPVRDLHSS